MSSHVSSGLGAAASAAAPAAALPARPAAADALFPLPAAVLELFDLPTAADRAVVGRVGRFASGMPSSAPALRFLSMTLDCAAANEATHDRANTQTMDQNVIALMHAFFCAQHRRI
jgi:hypothetical protein